MAATVVSTEPLKEDMKKKLDKSSIADFYNSETLSDITVLNPQTGAQYKTHKLILASGSKYFLELFLSEDNSKLTQFEIPKPIPVSGNQPDDAISKILKYFYNNQKFATISAEINEGNAPYMFSQAFVLKAETLKIELEEQIIKKILKPTNCTQFFLESIKFKCANLQKACEELMVVNFAEKAVSGEKGLTFLKDLPVEAFRAIMAADNLYIQDEKIVVQLIEEYIKHRGELPLLDEENPMKDWSNLTVDERAKRTEEEKKRTEEETKKKDEETKKQADEFAKLDDLGKIQYNWRKKIDEVHSKAMNRLSLKRLTKAQKIDLFKTIRYSFLHHDQLLGMTVNPIFELAKNFIVEGLAVKLDSPENAAKKALSITLDPRVYYEDGSYQHKGITGLPGEAGKENPLSGLFQSALNQKASDPVKINKTKMYSNYQERKEAEELETQKEVVKKNLLGQGMKGMFGDLQKKGQQPLQSYQTQPLLGKQKTDLLSQSVMLPQTGPKPPQKAVNQSMQLTTQLPLQERPTEFLYEYDFDEGGALFFLGSFGKKRLWQNPHTIGQIQAFTTSIGAGTVDLFAGRVAANCRTQNEPFSYFGVDLGEGRQILPTCYTIRNRNSTTHVLLNWHLEGSNDKVNWIILDRRIYGDVLQGGVELEEEQKHLKQKGAASTWGIDTDVYREVGFDGYRYYRVIQVGKNSSGSDNLALSGFEIYGKITSGRWP